MAQRHSGYERKQEYPTPHWVTKALLPHIPERVKTVWEPAAGAGRMSAVLSQKFDVVYSTDIVGGIDFLAQKEPLFDVDAIVTNPPWGRGYGYPEIGAKFVEQALQLTKRNLGFVAMLFPMNYDCAEITRGHLFRRCPQFAKKVVLTKRIVWFQPPPGSKNKGPSENHAWYLWDWTHDGSPTIAYEHG